MKKAVLLNDTSTRFHHGCSRVVQRINALLAERGITISASNPAHQDWRTNNSFVSALQSCEIIIINGEGSLHSGSKNGIDLLTITTSNERAGKPIALINTIWQDNPIQWIDFARKCEIVAVRDSHSAKELGVAGISNLRLVPDLSLTGPVPETLEQRSQILIGDSVRFDCRRVLARAAQFQRASYVPTKTLTSNFWKRKSCAELLWRTYNGTFTGRMPDFRMPEDQQAYLSELQKSRSHLSGRFHGICLSMLTETPFLAVVSKTTKVQTLIDDVGVDRQRLITKRLLSEQPFLVAPEFSQIELQKIHSYIEEANKSAQILFDDIRSLI